MPLTLLQYQSRLRWATRLALVCMIVAGASGLLLFYDLNVGTTLNILGLLLSEIILFFMAFVFFLLFRGFYKKRIQSLRST